MKFSTTFAAITCMGIAAGLPRQQQQQQQQQQQPSYGGAQNSGNSGRGGRAPKVAQCVYFQTNEPAGNKVVAMKIGRDGRPVSARAFNTGGRGSIGVVGNMTGPHSDALFSEGAVRVGGNMVYAVNAGSNTLSVFNINQADCSLSMCGRPISTLGEFPLSVTFSSKLQTACVVNGGAKDGVACYKFRQRTGLQHDGMGLRKFNIGQTTPANGPENTPSDIFFTRDSSALMVTVKGNPALNNTGFIGAYSTQRNGAVSTRLVKSSPDGTAVLFGSAVNPGANTFLSTDASFGYSLLGLNRNDMSVSSLGNFKIDGQGATCWAAFSARTNSYFVTDVKVNRIVEADGVNGQIVQQYQLSNGGPGNIDLQSGGDFLYALSPLKNNQVAIPVLDLSGGKGNAKEMRTYIVNGAGENSMGLTVFPENF